MIHEELISQQAQQNKLPPLLVLTGFRAAGKTAVGQQLARLCGYDFADTDALLLERMGCSIAEVVKRHGWPYFREQERLLLVEQASRRNTVLATGGGAILHQREWQLLRQQAVVIWLRTDLAATLARLRQDAQTAEQRPCLLHQTDDLETETAAVLQEREPLYRAGADVVVDTGNKTLAELSLSLLERLNALDKEFFRFVPG